MLDVTLHCQSSQNVVNNSQLGIQNVAHIWVLGARADTIIAAVWWLEKSNSKSCVIPKIVCITQSWFLVTLCVILLFLLLLFFVLCIYAIFACVLPWPESKQEGSSGPRQNLRFLKVNYVKDVTLLGQVEEQFELKTPYLDMTSLQNREEAAIRYFFSFILKSSSQSFEEVFFTELHILDQCPVRMYPEPPDLYDPTGYAKYEG